MKYCPQCSSSFPSSVVFCPKDDAFLIDKNELDPGMIIRNKYEIVRLIGSGGMASVYEARHIAFNERVAIKVVKPGIATDEEFLARFRTEARVARKLAHPNAVNVMDLDETEDGMPFIVMELVIGADLRAVMHESGPFSVIRALRVAKQVAAALSAAHSLGIIHRDIKPDNIVLSGAGENETAKVLDFGIARTQGDQNNPHATKTGMMVGTPEYASPEQATGVKSSQLDGRCDIYSLGVTLYEMLTGVSPFKADSGVEMLIKHVHEVPQRPDLLKPERGIPAAVAELVMKCLEKQRENRFQIADDLIAEITRCERIALYSAPRPQSRAAAAAAAPVNESTPEQRASAPSVPKPAQPKASTPKAPVPEREPVFHQIDEEEESKSKLPRLIGLVTLLAVMAGAWWANARHQRQLDIASQAQDIVHAYPGVQSEVNFALRVVLSGTVKSSDDSQQIASMIRAVGGVTDVVNQLTVVAPPPSESKPSEEQNAGGQNPAAPTENARPSLEQSPEQSSEGSSSGNADEENSADKPAAPQPKAPSNASAKEIGSLVSEARKQRENGDYDAAIKTLKRALALDKTNAAARAELKRVQEAKQAEEDVLQRRR